jgi:hypothetical protein
VIVSFVCQSIADMDRVMMCVSGVLGYWCASDSRHFPVSVSLPYYFARRADADTRSTTTASVMALTRLGGSQMETISPARAVPGYHCAAHSVRHLQIGAFCLAPDVRLRSAIPVPGRA